MRDQLSEIREEVALGAGLEAWDSFRYRTWWTCEKWSEEACEFVRRRLGLPTAAEITSAALRSLGIQPELVEEIAGNLFLNEGKDELIDLLIAAGGTTAYNNANAEIGVGDSSTAEAATQTDLQAATNKLYKAMVATYPIRTAESCDWRSDFTTSEANWAWLEWSIRNGVTRNKNLNRKVQSLGTKATGTWTLTATIAF